MIKDTNFSTTKNIWWFNSFLFLVISYLFILGDSIYFYQNSFSNIEKYFIIWLNLVLIILLYLYKRKYNNIEVNTITYKYTLDEYIIEIIKSIVLLFKKEK